MGVITWKSISVGQFQEIQRIVIDKGVDEFDRIARLVCIVYNLTEAQVDDLPVLEFNKLSSACRFLINDEIPGKPVRSIWVGTRKYAINYKPTALRHRQYVEITSFAEDPIKNMHLIMASLVNPVKWGIKRKNKAEDHEKVANDMLNARIVDAYHVCVFFCKLFRNSIEATRASLIIQMTMAGMKEEEAHLILQSSISAMDGYLTLKR